MKKAIFFDRDGVINELVPRDGYYYSPRYKNDFKLIPNIIDLINLIREKSYKIVVVSNQPDIARGLMSVLELEKITNVLFNKLKIDDVFYCIHDDLDNCECRKPKPGLILEAKEKWNINLKKSLMIGDTQKDLEAASSAGVKFLLINTDYNKKINNCIRIDKLDQIIEYLN